MKAAIAGLPLTHKCASFYLSKKSTNSFVIDKIPFVHTDTTVKKIGNTFVLNLASSVVVVFCRSKT